jgi:hypothetical protein
VHEKPPNRQRQYEPGTQHDEPAMERFRPGLIVAEPSQPACESPVASASARHVALLLDLGCLAAQVAQVVELGATHFAGALDFDLLDEG